MAGQIYHSISVDDIAMKIADAVVAREQEVFHYDLNIDNYTAMLATLPQGEWPKELALFKGKGPDTYPEDRVQEISDLEFRDRLILLLRTERIERSKAALVLDTLKARIPAETFATAIAEAVVRVKSPVSA